jgi:hypothetical protein
MPLRYPEGAVAILKIGHAARNCSMALNFIKKNLQVNKKSVPLQSDSKKLC